MLRVAPHAQQVAAQHRGRVASRRGQGAGGRVLIGRPPFVRSGRSGRGRRRRGRGWSRRGARPRRPRGRGGRARPQRRRRRRRSGRWSVERVVVACGAGEGERGRVQGRRVGEPQPDVPPGTSRLSSAGVPSATIRPPSRTATRWASWSASSRYCVVSRTVTPSATSPRTMSHIARRLRGSRPVVGSSRKITGGSPISVMARSSLRRMPPENPATGLLGGVRRSKRSSRSSARRRALDAAEVVQVGHQPKVLLGGEQVVDGRELAGDADRGTHGVGMTSRRRGRPPPPYRRRRGPAWTGC